jgi:hypothetical protein
MPNINLATKYEGKLLQAYTRESIITGKYNPDYDFNGVSSIHILTAVTQPLNNYDRTASGNRFGTPTELEDSKQELILRNDKSFAIVVDRGNYTDQMMAKKTGEVTKAQIGEQVVPWFDKLALTTWAHHAGQATPMAAVTKDTVLDMFIAAHSHFFNNAVPVDPSRCYAYVTTTTYAKLLRNPEFISVEKLGEKDLTKGVVGKCMNFTVIEVPDGYFDATMTENGTAMADVAGTQALFVNKKSVIFAQKMKELFIRNNPPGISGVLIEGRYRGDAFVLDTINKGVLKVGTTS